MTALLLLPLILPFLAPMPARRTLDLLAPATALWVLTASALALAGACVAALGALVLTGLLKLPAFAALGELVHPLRTPSDYIVLPIAVAATGGLTLSVWTLARSAFRLCPAGPTASSSPPPCCAVWDLPSVRPSSPMSAPTTGRATITSWPPPHSC